MNFNVWRTLRIESTLRTATVPTESSRLFEGIIKYGIARPFVKVAEHDGIPLRQLGARCARQ